MDEQVKNTNIQESSKAASRIKITLEKKKVYAIIGGIVILCIVIGIAFLNQKSKDGVLATVGNKPVYTSYLDKEMELYPGTKSPEVKKMLEQKIIDDQITLEAAKKEGLIKSYPQGNNLSSAEYLKRTQEVQNVQTIVEGKANGIDVEIVSIWFHNGLPASVGYEQGERIAAEKIAALYERVKKKEITVKQAGQLIASDTELSKLDPAYKENAYSSYKASNGEKITFWPKFDGILRASKPGEVTKIFTGTDVDTKGNTIPILYAFGQVVDKTNDSGIKNYNDWLSKNKKTYEIVTY